MTRWDSLLAVQEHDTTADQIVHRKRSLPGRAELDQVMDRLGVLELRSSTSRIASTSSCGRSSASRTRSPR